MPNEVTTTKATDIERVLIQGDLSKLSADQRTTYYLKVCESVGLNPLTQPFNYLNLSGKLVLYATKACTEQLRVIFGVSVEAVDGKLVDDCYVVTASGVNATGRKDTATGAVSVANLKGEAKCNALMKAETKAKRRLTLSLCGLGLLDESEVSSIPGAKPEAFQYAPPRGEQAERVNDDTGEIEEGDFQESEAREFFDDMASGLFITDEQCGIIKNAANAAGLNLQRILDKYVVSEIESITPPDFGKVMADIENYQRAKARRAA